MRWFGQQAPTEEPDANTETEEQQQPDTEPQPVEPVLPDDADLSSLYSDDGEALYEDDQGNPTDAEGNPIPARRPEAVSEPEPEPQPAPAPPTFRSPYADGLLNDAEQEELDGLVDPRVQHFMFQTAQRIADRTLASQQQQRVAARSLGLDPAVLEDLAPAINQAEQHIPANIRGTKEGAIAAVLTAIGQEASQTGDLGAVLKRITGVQAAPAPQPRTPALIPPGARMTMPRGTPDQTRQAARARGPRDIANESFHKDGLEGDVIATLQRERKGR